MADYESLEKGTSCSQPNLTYHSGGPWNVNGRENGEGEGEGEEGVTFHSDPQSLTPWTTLMSIPFVSTWSRNQRKWKRILA
jgi:hypothetical protein